MPRAKVVTQRRRASAGASGDEPRRPRAGRSRCAKKTSTELRKYALRSAGVEPSANLVDPLLNAYLSLAT